VLLGAVLLREAGRPERPGPGLRKSGGDEAIGRDDPVAPLVDERAPPDVVLPSRPGRLAAVFVPFLRAPLDGVREDARPLPRHQGDDRSVFVRDPPADLRDLQANPKWLREVERIRVVELSGLLAEKRRGGVGIRMLLEFLARGAVVRRSVVPLFRAPWLGCHDEAGRTVLGEEELARLDEAVVFRLRAGDPHELA